MNQLATHIAALDSGQRHRALAWIWLGVLALLTGGLMSLMLVVARTPVLQDLLPGHDFFHVALVVHVDLTVLVWFMASAGLGWTVFGTAAHGAWQSVAIVIAATGAGMIAVAPVVGADQPLMNNYIPVLRHAWFYTALLVLGAGLTLQACLYLAHGYLLGRVTDKLGIVRYALSIAAVTALAAIASVAWSYAQLPSGLDEKFYFEAMFWGGGHVLQFTNTVLVLLAWLLLAWACGGRVWMTPVLGARLFMLTALPLLAVPFVYAEGVATDAGLRGFTELMRWGGLASLPLGVMLLASLFVRNRGRAETKPLRATMLCSLSLFAAGGLIGFMIKGSNTMIPAHYHGSIVGVTLAFMGVVYWVLPGLGLAIRQRGMLALQPYLYGGGQLLHITGLAMSGGYGVQRKVAGADQMLDGMAQALGMGMMGLGGLLATVGGLCFMIITISALRGTPRATASESAYPGVVAGAG